MPVCDRRNHGLAHAVGGVQTKFVTPFVEYVDRAGICVRQFDRPADDGGEHSFEVEASSSLLGLTSPSAFQLLDRTSEFTSTGLHLLEQPHVLDRDHRLVGEGREQFYLLVAERDRALTR